MDERVRLVKSPSGATEFRINHADLHDLGEHAFIAEIVARGIDLDDLGQPENMKHRGYWKVPVRKTGDSE